MIQSMTGFGKAAGLVNEKKVLVEIRSLNSKQLDANLRLPSLYKEKELELRNILLQELSRGKVDFSLFVEIPEKMKAQTINKQAVLQYYQQLKEIALQTDTLNNQELFSLAVKMPDTISTEREELDENEWFFIQEFVREAITQLNDFRSIEGAALEIELRKRIQEILDLLLKVEPFEQNRIGLLKERIIKNLDELIAKGAIADQNRLEQELIFYLEKLDITEEKVRLKTHCDYFLEVLSTETNQGKKLGFITQEIGREINTLGSKANNQDIQKLVVQMKDELEKLKEQLLNTL